MSKHPYEHKKVKMGGYPCHIKKTIHYLKIFLECIIVPLTRCKKASLDKYLIDTKLQSNL